MSKELQYEILKDLTINQISPTKTILKAHTNSIQCIAANINYKQFASGSHDKTIKIWDLEKTQQIMQLADHKQGVWSLQYSKDGAQLLSASPDSLIQIWDSKKGSVGIRLKGHKDKVYDAKFNTSNKNVASCGVGGEILIWDLSSPSKPIKTINIKQTIAYQVQWSKNDQLMFVTTSESKLYIFDGTTFQQLSCESLSDEKPSKCETFTTNFELFPNKMFLGTDKGTLAIYEYEKTSKKAINILQYTAHMDECKKVALHPTKKLLISSSRDGSVRLWNLSNIDHPKIISNLVLHSQTVAGCAFLDNWVITGSWDQKIGLWNINELMKKI